MKRVTYFFKANLKNGGYFRSSYPEVFSRKDILKNSENFNTPLGNTFARVSLLAKL